MIVNDMKLTRRQELGALLFDKFTLTINYCIDIDCNLARAKVFK